MNPTRREILKGAGASVVLGSLGCSIFGGESGGKDLIPRQEKPYNAEPRLDVLAESWITPYSHFYVRNHGTMPTVDGAGYKLTIEGLVDRSVRLSLEDFDKLPKATVLATMQCAGNRRSDHGRVKPVAGVAWDSGAIGT